MSKNDDLVRRLRVMGDETRRYRLHREYCKTAREAADAIERGSAQGVTEIPSTDEVVQYVMRYGGDCRDCADEMGVCPNSGLPCEMKDARRAIGHVISALNYGFSHGYLSTPPAPAPDAGEEDLEYLLQCVEAHADKFPVPSHMRNLVARLRSPTPQPPAVEAGARTEKVWVQNLRGFLLQGIIFRDTWKEIWMREVDALIQDNKAKTDEIERLTNLVDRIRNEAIGHSMEARGANATVNECYRAVTEGKGEPGNWHGAEPVKAELERLRRERDEWKNSAFLSDCEAQSGQLEEMTARAEAAEASNKALREGLEPFAREADQWEGYSDDENLVEGWTTGPSSSLNVGDLRRARALLSETGATE